MLHADHGVVSSHHRIRDQHHLPHASADPDPDPSPNGHANSDADRDTNVFSYWCPVNVAYSIADIHTDCAANRNAHNFADASAIGNTDPGSNGNADVDADERSNSVAVAGAHRHANIHANRVSYHSSCLSLRRDVPNHHTAFVQC